MYKKLTNKNRARHEYKSVHSCIPSLNFFCFSSSVASIEPGRSPYEDDDDKRQADDSQRGFITSLGGISTPATVAQSHRHRRRFFKMQLSQPTTPPAELQVCSSSTSNNIDNNSSSSGNFDRRNESSCHILMSRRFGCARAVPV